MSDPFIERLFAGIPEEVAKLRPHIAELEAFNQRVAAGVVAEAERWKAVIPACALKGITEADARRIAAEHHGTVWRSTVTLYADGGEYQSPWERA